MTYTAMGKQVLLDGTHYADARDPVVAQQIVEALRLSDDLRYYEGPAPFEPPELDAPTIRYMGRHQVTQQQDEYACICGRRWDVSDGPEHP